MEVGREVRGWNKIKVKVESSRGEVERENGEGTITDSKGHGRP